MPTRLADDNPGSSRLRLEVEPAGGGETGTRSDPEFPTLPQLALSPMSNLCKARVRQGLFQKMEPIRVGHFVLLKRLGAGAMGEIFEAFDEQLDRRVALKLVRSGSSLTPESDELLLREARTLAQVSHPNVVQIYEVGMHDGRPFIAMELVRGQTLTSWVREAAQLPRPHRQRELLRMFIAAGRGLEAAHAAGVAHRDFKPDNVLVGEDGRVRVVDFGLARVVGPGARVIRAGGRGADLASISADLEHGETVRIEPDGAVSGAGPTAPAPELESTARSSDTLTGAPERAAPTPPAEARLTRTGTVMGTPRFMAPEQIRGGVADHRSDQFSFCVALYHALHDDFPFQGNYPKELLASIESGVSGLEHRAALGTRLRKALSRGLAVDPAQRFADMGELLTEVESTLRRGRAWLTGALVLVVIGVVAHLWPSAPTDPCALAGDGMAASWSMPQQLAVQVAFARSGKPYADTTWRATRQRLDDYSRRWRDEANAACRARYVLREESELQFGQRTMCLQRAHGQVAALVSELATGAGDTVQHALAAAEALPELRACHDHGTMMQGIAPPPAAIAPIVEQVRKQLAMALTQERLGRAEQSLVIAREARAATEQLKYPPVRAEALTQIARALDQRQTADARKEAEGLYFEALDIAEGERHDQLVAMIWTRLIHLSLQMESGTQQAYERWRRNAAAVHRNGDSTDEQAGLHHLLAEIYYRDGKYAEAILEENRAIAALADAPEHQLELSRYYDTLAKSLERHDGLEQSLQLHERALTIARNAQGAAHPDVLKLRMHYALALKKHGELERARSELEAALEEIPVTRRASYLDAGVLHSYLSEVSYEDGKLDDAAQHATASVQIFQRAGAPDRRVAEAHIDLGNIELKRKHFAGALAEYERALQLRKDLPVGHYQLAVNKGSLAEALVGLERYDEAMVQLRDAERILESSSARDRDTQAWMLTVRGEVLAGQHKLNEAASALDRALLLCDDVRDPSNHAYAAWALARVLHRLERSPQRVRQLAEQARALFARLGSHEASSLRAVDQFMQGVSPAPVSSTPGTGPSRGTRE